MALTKKKMLIEVNENINTLATAVQLDANSRYLDVFLYDGGVPIDLTGHVVRIHVKKTDGTTIFNQGEITDTTAGRCQFALTADMLNEAQTLEAQISIWSDDTEILSTKVFKILVTESLRNDEEVEATNEFGVMVVLFTEVLSALNLMKEMTETFGLPSDKAADMGATTFWQMLEELALRADARSIIKENINSTMDTEGFVPIDRMIVKHGTETFTSDGTFIVPDGVYKIWVTACAGGGGGGGATWNRSYTTGAGGGGGGALIVNKPYNVTPGQSIPITIGKGGAGGASAFTYGDDKDGSNGGNTIVGDLVTLKGGYGGKRPANGLDLNQGGYGGAGGDGSAGYGGAGGYYVKDTSNYLDGFNGGKSIYPYLIQTRSETDTNGYNVINGGDIANSGNRDNKSYYGAGGGGGGCSIGAGGTGGSAGDSDAIGANPTAGILGGGGGGGAANEHSNESQSGAAGGDGICIIEW